MDSLDNLLSSISPEDMERIKSVASSLGAAPQTPSAETSAGVPALTDEMSNMLIKVASQMNKDSDKTAFIKALRPLLSEERRKKADEATRFLKLMDTLPLLRGMFG